MKHTIFITGLRVLLCSTIILCGTIAFAKNFPPQARHALIKAQNFIKNEKMAEADKILSQYLQSTKETVPAEIFIMLGGARNDVGNKAGALKSFLNGLKLYPGNKPLCHNSAVLLYEQQKYAQAAKLFEKTYELANPKDPHMLYHAGAAFYEGCKYAESARVMSRLLTTTQILKKEWIKLAVHSYLQAGQKKKALNYLNTLLKKFPQEAEYWKLLAKVEMDRNRYVQAAAALEIAYSFIPPKEQESRQLIQIYKYVNAPLKAANSMSNLYGKNPSPKQAQELALLYQRAGKIQKALKVIERSLAIASEGSSSQKLLLTKGKILYSLRKYDMAKETFSLCLKNEPTPEAKLYRALCFWELKQWELSRKDFEQIKGLKKYKTKAQSALAALDDLAEARAEANKG